MEKMVDEKVQPKVQDEDFEIVGPNYQVHVVKTTKKKPFRKKLKGKPIVSIVILSLIVLGCLFAGLLMNHDPGGFYLDHLNSAPSRDFLFGTDSLGRDIYSMIWNGGRVSLIIGLLGAAISTGIGIFYGCISGTANRAIDSFMMRLAEVISSIPQLLILLLLLSIIGNQSIVSIAVVIGITSWMSLARIVRSEVRQIRNSEYVLASRSMGASFMHIIFKHLIPNFLSAIMFMVVSSVSTTMAMESTLSFLGLGLPVDVISWGSMMSLSNRALLTNSWWVIIIPGLFMVVTLLCITNIGNFLRKETNRRSSNL